MMQNSAFLLRDKSVWSFQFLCYVFHLFVADESVASVKIVTEKPMLNGQITLLLEACSEDRRH